jgi:transcriptional regulator with XRE-family HTH domain
MQQQTHEIRRTIGENIREERRQMKMTQAQLAEKVGLSIQFLSNLENGLQFARMETYCKIAEFLAFPLNALFLSAQLQLGELDEQIRLHLRSCTEAEKRVLLNIMREVKTLI